MATSKAVWEAAPLDSKVQFVLAMFREKHPGIRVEIVTGMGDFTEFFFEGIARHRVSNTFLAVSDPSQIYKELEKAIAYYKPMGKSRVTVEKQTVKGESDAWAEKWANEHGEG